MTSQAHSQRSSFKQVLSTNKLTFGLLTPIEGYPQSDIPTLHQHLELAKLADESGFAALWLRDVPFRDPTFGDVAQVFDPMVYASWLSASTTKISIGTAGMILPLRDPIAISKQALSVDQLSQGRFILGVSSGDRPSEYPAFGIQFEERASIFRDSFEMIRVLSQQTFPRHKSQHFGNLDGSLDLLPKPFTGQLPIVAVGRCGQELDWLAQHADAWIGHQSHLESLPALIRAWHTSSLSEPKPYGYGTFFELDRNPNAPLIWGRGIRAGRNTLIDLWRRQQEQGVSHVALNLRVSHRPAKETLLELAEYVLPQFA
ncbi:LLM class oxidoreductase [Rheinheimera texasensis]|uniref:LLM class oxidoreductase n=1 Tax=Rheinheimera texasensis TaxID=306205 RepID=UPI0004E23CB7|nr:LLM class oxidoreductase [Rheinheimera texasensis]